MAHAVKYRRYFLMKDNNINKLNSLKLYKCENIKIGDMFKNNFIYSETLSCKMALKALFRIFYFSLFALDIKIAGIPKTVSINLQRTRNDHIRAFTDVTKLLKNQMLIDPSKKIIKLSNVKNVYLPFVWMNQMNRLTLNFRTKLIFSSLLYKSYIIFNSIKEKSKKNKFEIKFLITYSDVADVIENFIVQSYNNDGVITITLQHGFYDISVNSWFFSGSKSKYLLADSPASADLAKIAGYKGCVIPIGSPHQLNEEIAHSLCCNKNVNTLGIIMNAPDYKISDNISMIDVVQKYAKKHHKKVILKFHPANHREDYMKYIDTSVTEILDKDATIDLFSELVDVAIVCESTVFTTMLRKGKPVLLFYPLGCSNYMFRNTEFIRFSSPNELEMKISTVHSIEYYEEYLKYQNYFLCSGNYKENYIDFFKKIGMID